MGEAQYKFEQFTQTKGRTMTSEEIVKYLKSCNVNGEHNVFETAAATLIESQAKEIADMHGALDFGVKCNDDLQAQVESQAQTIAELQKDKARLEGLLANELGIEKAYPNAGDDESKTWWIGVNNECYESQLQAIDAATKGEKR